jgi:succinyl-CoA synthetase beta subunit
MNLHEYQAKKILKRYGIPVPDSGVAATPKEAEYVIDGLHLKEAVVKIQVHAGGRGKAGGVKFAKGRSEILEVVKALLGMKLVNRQTGPEGVIAKRVLISKPVEIAKEYYLGALIDRNRGSAILIASPQGGMEIEEIAEKSPEKILTLPFSETGKLRGYQIVRLLKFMGWTGDLAKKGASFVENICRCFMENDASLLEINPLVLSPGGDLLALDAKMSIDDNALFRQPEASSFFDPTQLSPQEAMAKEEDLAYIAMHGTIGCMVNGAGLAMATMDIIRLYGESPANFLDVGGSASKEKVAAGFRIILSDPNVRAVLVNIFGGIMNCATIAEGVIHAAGELKIKVPIVVRLEGTNVAEGRRLFEESRLKLTVADSLADAARKAVKAVG